MKHLIGCAGFFSWLLVIFVFAATGELLGELLALGLFLGGVTLGIVELARWYARRRARRYGLTDFD